MDGGVDEQLEDRRWEEQQGLLGSENAWFSFILFLCFGYVYPWDSMLIMFLDLYYRQPALTLSPCVTQLIIVKAIFLPDLNDATSSVESFPVFSFPQVFAPPSLLSKRIGQTGICRCHHPLLICFWDYAHWLPEDYCLASRYRGFRCKFPIYSLFFAFLTRIKNLCSLRLHLRRKFWFDPLLLGQRLLDLFCLLLWPMIRACPPF